MTLLGFALRSDLVNASYEQNFRCANVMLLSRKLLFLNYKVMSHMVMGKSRIVLIVWNVQSKDLIGITDGLLRFVVRDLLRKDL